LFTARTLDDRPSTHPFSLVKLQDVAFFKIVESGDADATLKAGPDLSHVLLEALQ
jgi:hypothetical protein